MSFTEDLFTAVAESLDAAGVALWATTWPASPTLPVISIASTPDQPDHIITLSPYGVNDTPHEHSTVGLQVRSRGGRNPITAYDLDDAVFLVLHRPRGATFGASGQLVVSGSYRNSGPAPLGVDQAGRFELTSNYYLLVERASVDPWS